MRRLVVTFVSLAALSVPAVAVAMQDAPGDGTLVVKDGQAPPTVPVVALKITGTAIGRVAEGGKIVIDDPTPNNGVGPEVTGYDWHRVSTLSDTAQVWGGVDPFKFRAAGGTYTILVYGSGVDITVVGTGTVKLAGTPDTPAGDGKYSLNGKDFRSLPGTQTAFLTIGTPPTTTTTTG